MKTLEYARSRLARLLIVAMGSLVSLVGCGPVSANVDKVESGGNGGHTNVDQAQIGQISSSNTNGATNVQSAQVQSVSSAGGQTTIQNANVNMDLSKLLGGAKYVLLRAPAILRECATPQACQCVVRYNQPSLLDKMLYNTNQDFTYTVVKIASDMQTAACYGVKERWAESGGKYQFFLRPIGTSTLIPMQPVGGTDDLNSIR